MTVPPSVLSFRIPGRPKTKGSVDIVPIGKLCRCCAKCKARMSGYVVRQSVQGSERWADMVRHAAAQVWVRPPLAGEVTVALWFWLPVSDVIAAGVGDLDKLERNILDGLTKAQVYRDDVQVVKMLSEKTPAGDGGAGVTIQVWDGRL